jgi:hypothetical protein
MEGNPVESSRGLGAQLHGDFLSHPGGQAVDVHSRTLAEDVLTVDVSEEAEQSIAQTFP